MRVRRLIEELDNIKEEQFEKFLDRVRQETNNNNHCEAFVAVANFFGWEDLEEKFQEFLNLRDYQGYLTMGDAERRYEVYKEMRQRLFDEIGEEDAKRVLGVL